MTTVLYGLRNCDKVRKARAFLDAAGHGYRFHDYKANGIDRVTLGRWCEAAGWETVINRSGTTFRKLPDEMKEGLDKDRAIELMVEQPSMIKRPVLEAGERILVGFRESEYEALAG